MSYPDELHGGENPDIIDNIDELSGKFDTEQAELTKAEENGFFQLWKAVELLSNHVYHIEKRLENMGHKIE